MPTLALVFLALSALALVVGLALFILLKRELRSLERRFSTQRVNAEQLCSQFKRELEELRDKMDRLSQTPPTRDMPTLMNPYQRTQALRLLRRGEEVDAVCSALKIHRSEALLLKKIRDATQQEGKNRQPLAC
jgi:Tfp pilus assembly protein PilO